MHLLTLSFNQSLKVKEMNSEVKQYVTDLLSDKRGHGVEHVIRVHH